jgi:hypothetical protein
MPDKEYFISKLSLDEHTKLISDVTAYAYDGINLEELGDKVRSWLVYRQGEGASISALLKNNKGGWSRGNRFTYTNSLFTWDCQLPKNVARHKAFVSYYHFDDQYYFEQFDNFFRDLIVSKSVLDGDIDSANSHGYVKQLIQNGYLHDTTVLIVLIGPKTKCRMHVDWEISGALNVKVGDKYAGLLGVLLPTHPDYGTGRYKNINLPQRLAANLASGYAKIIEWTENRAELQKHIEEAFAARENDQLIVNAGLLQMEENTCD